MIASGQNIFALIYFVLSAKLNFNRNILSKKLSLCDIIPTLELPCVSWISYLP